MLGLRLLSKPYRKEELAAALARRAGGVIRMADILIIDDDRQIRRLLIRVLEGAGHVVREAENGREGLRLFEEQTPSLIVTDIVMPGHGGHRDHRQPAAR